MELRNQESGTKRAARAARASWLRLRRALGSGSAGTAQLAIVAYVPKPKSNKSAEKVDVTEWIKSVAAGRPPCGHGTRACREGQKLLKTVIKEGGKKGVEIEGAAEMGGLDFLCTTIESPEGDRSLLLTAMQAMNANPDPLAEERKGCSGFVGKMIFRRLRRDAHGERRGGRGARRGAAQVWRIAQGHLTHQPPLRKRRGDRECARGPARLREARGSRPDQLVVRRARRQRCARGARACLPAAHPAARGRAGAR